MHRAASGYHDSAPCPGRTSGSCGSGSAGISKLRRRGDGRRRCRRFRLVPIRASEGMTASLHALGGGRDAGLYYVNDPNREARPKSRDEYYVRDGGGTWWSTGETIVRHGAEIDKET